MAINIYKPKKSVFIRNFCHKNVQVLAFWPQIYVKNYEFWEKIQLYKSRILSKFGKTDKLTADKLTDLTVLDKIFINMPKLLKTYRKNLLK